MKPTLEARPWLDESMSLRAFRRAERKFDWNWHYHPEWELTLITRGNGARLVGDHSERYRAGDLVLLGGNLPHTWASGEGGNSAKSQEAVVVHFVAGAYPESLLEMEEFQPLRRLLARSGQGIAFSPVMTPGLLEDIRSLPEKHGADAWLALTSVLNRLSGLEGRTLASASYRARRSFKIGTRLGRVIAHMEACSDGPLALADVARFAALTPASFARFFRRMTGKTFVEYRNGCRVRNACRMLVESDRTVLDISLACGFQNLSNFNRCFRAALGMPPRAYRRQWSKPGSLRSVG